MVELLQDDTGYTLRQTEDQKGAAQRICDVVGMGWNWMMKYSIPSHPALEEPASIIAAFFVVVFRYFCQLRANLFGVFTSFV